MTGLGHGAISRLTIILLNIITARAHRHGGRRHLCQLGRIDKSIVNGAGHKGTGFSNPLRIFVFVDNGLEFSNGVSTVIARVVFVEIGIHAKFGAICIKPGLCPVCPFYESAINGQELVKGRLGIRIGAVLHSVFAIGLPQLKIPGIGRVSGRGLTS